MQKIFILLSFLMIVSSCSDSDCVSASCVSPPEGTFDSDRYNIAIFPVVSTSGTQNYRTADFSLDSVVVHSNDDVLIKEFYTWKTIVNPQSVTSFTLYVGEDSFLVEGKLPDLEGNLKGYIIGFKQEGETTQLIGEQASEDLINGVCNDVISC